MKQFNLKHLLLLMAFSLLVVACSKDDSGDNGGSNKPDEQPVLSKDNSMHSFSFTKAKNATFTTDYKPVNNGTTVYITVQEDANMTALVPTINVHDKATVLINNATYDHKNPTAVDFSKTVKITVKSESGDTKTYTVLAKAGNPSVDNRVYNFMIKHDLPGVSIALSKNEEIVYRAAFGWADKAKEERATVDHLFRLASMSKQHTAIAIMSLYEAGKLDLDDTVFGEKGILSKYGNDMSSAAKSITVKHLLSHTSGYSVDCIFPSKSIYYNKTLDERIQTLVDNETVAYTPGHTYSYNNSNFGILSMVVEVVSGKSFEQYLKEDIYTPIGISDIYGGKNSESQKIGKEVTYYGQDGKNAYGNDVENGIGAGGIIATPTALMKLMAHIDYGTKVADIFKKETLDEMYEPQQMFNTSGNPYQKYALGWRCKYTDFPNWENFHGGTLAGVCTIWARSKSNVNGVILCNSRSYNQSIDDEMWYLLDDFQEMYK